MVAINHLVLFISTRSCRREQLLAMRHMRQPEAPAYAVLIMSTLVNARDNCAIEQVTS